MGNEESKPKPRVIPMPTPPPRSIYSEVEVVQLLEKQKEHFDKKVQQLLKVQKESQSCNPHNSASAGISQASPSTSQTARKPVGISSSAAAGISQASPSTSQAARNPVGISPSTAAGISQAGSSSSTSQNGRNPVKIIPSTSAGPSTSQAAGNSAIISAVERNRSPYNYNHSQLSQQATRPLSLYPNLNTLQQQGPSNARPATSDNVFVNRSGIAERCVPVPSAPPAPRDRSSSRPRSKKEDERDEVKCPTCRNMYGLTIFQCSSGHSSCLECKNANRVCGKCYKPIGNMRNIMLEELVSEMKIKCPHSEDGCNLFIKMADMQNHARECPFRELPCPLSSTAGCMWKGKLSNVSDHFAAMHPMNCQGAVDTEMTLLNLQNNCQIAHLVVIGNFNFIFHLMVNQAVGNVYIAVQLIGTNISASKWTYDVHVYNKSEPRRKFQYVDVCTSTSTNIFDIISKAKCAVVPLSYALTFICDNKLYYKFYIKKEANERPFGNNRGRGRGRGGHHK